ncbi:hypothetical protein [Novosphingobium sp. MBES04]|uniref:hypothetical protein n=1 Tax=Novosphingobium sp. MBES04 TaxID=1206458 RepID=UPI00057D42BE|nr:hypothetical protein [Novosphingobium sp. MBES04]GAM05390.1 hypothetical protein MBENS4_2388 [Novosphingobium sp. MBES04]
MSRIITAYEGPLAISETANDQTLIYSGENTYEARRLAELSKTWAEGLASPGDPGTRSAKSWAGAAQLSAGTAEAFVGPTYGSTQDALDQTNDGDFFAIQTEGLVSIYRNEANTAVLQRTVATSDFLGSPQGAMAVTVANGFTVQQNLTDLQADDMRRIDLREYRAGVGIGDETADTDALKAAFADAAALVGGQNGSAAPIYRNKIWLPKGNILLGESLKSTGNFAVFFEGQGRDATRIHIPDGEYLLDSDHRSFGISFQNLQTRGGKGVFRRSGLAPAIGGASGGIGLLVDGCAFYDYTECALGSSSNDDPFWRISRSKFTGSVGSKAIMLPTGGGHDIRSNWINQYKYGICLRNGYDVLIDGNRFGGLTNGPVRTDIWIIPTSNSSGSGLKISRNYHGNENDSPEDRSVLIAAADTSSNADHATNPTWEAYEESNAAVDSSYIVGQVSFHDNLHALDSGRSRGLIYSRTTNLRSFTWQDKIFGAAPYIFEFDNALFTSFDKNNRWAQTNTVTVDSDVFAGAAPSTDAVCNLPGFGQIDSPSGRMSGQADIPLAAAPFAADCTTLLDSTTSIASLLTVSGANITLGQSDAVNGRDAAAVNLTAGSGSVRLPLDLTNAQEGRLCHLEIDLAQALTQSLPGVYIRIGEGVSSYFKSVYVPLNPTWRTIHVPFVLPNAQASTFRVVICAHSSDFASGVSDTFHVGRIFVYQAQHRVSSLQVPGCSTNNDSTSKTLHVRSSKPTQVWDSPLLQDCSVSFSTAAAYPGARFRIVRGPGASGNHALLLGDGPFKTLDLPGSWCEVEYDGTSWLSVGAGFL